MNEHSTHEVTQLLVAWNNGDQMALEQLVPMVHAELHKLARRYMGGERAGHPLQPTALVNEAYMRLIDWKNVEWKNRAHFFGVSAQLMRRILVDFARQRPRVRRRELHSPPRDLQRSIQVVIHPDQALFSPIAVCNALADR